MKGPVRRTRSGSFRLHLDPAERALLGTVVTQMRELLASDEAAATEGSDDPALARLFPPADREDEQRAAAYRRLVGGELSASHRAALDTIEATLEAGELSEDEVLGWMRAVNAVRLVLGTRLDVREDDPGLPDPTDPDAAARMAYHWLSYLLDHIVDALGEPTPG